VESAEDADFPPSHFDLITVAQAVHWFHFDRFYAVVNRVLKPDGIFAALGYGLMTTDGAANDVIRYLYHSIPGGYWDPERRYIDEGYQTIPFPFKEQPAPSFQLTVQWTIEHVLGYLNTWSAVQHYRKQRGEDPVGAIRKDLTSAWGGAATKAMRFPMLMRIGMKKY